jgi:hypothetical protein
LALGVLYGEASEGFKKERRAIMELNTEIFELDVNIEELEAKIAPDDNGETVLPLPRGSRR